MTNDPSPVAALLLDPPPLAPAEVTRLERSLAAVLHTAADVVLVPSEAILAIEAVAAGLGRPGGRALNVVTGPYGHQISSWLAQAGHEVVEIAVPFDRAAAPATAVAALDDGGPFDLVIVTHAESATGVVNPIGAIVGAARERGALTFVDAVASVGAEALDVDGLGIDVCVIGPQKGLAGPQGISAVTVNDRAWARLRSRSPQIRHSSLSLLDWKDNWIDGPRKAIPGYLPVLETRAFQAAVDRVAAEGIDAVVERHRRAAMAVRAGLPALGLRPWVPGTADAAAVATLVRVPDDSEPAALVAAALASCPAPLEVAPGGLGLPAIRVSHTGRRATLADVLAALAALAGGLEHLGGTVVDAGPGLDAARRAWRS